MLKRKLSIALSLVLMLVTILPGFSVSASEEAATVKYGTLDPRAVSVTLETDYTDGKIYYTLDGTSPAADNGTEYTGAVSIPQGTVKLTSAVFANGEKVSEDFCHTYINNAGTHLGVQTDATKITGTNTTVNGTNYVKYAFDGVNEFIYSPTESNYMGLYRGYYQNPIIATVEYETPITVDTLTAAVRVCEAQYLTDVSAGGNGTNSDKKQEKKTEYLKKDLSVQLKVDYVKEGESEFTEGAWQTVTMPAGYECEWNYEYKYGAAWTYLPAISFDAATVSKIRISIKDYATGSDSTDVRLWSIKEYELYKSKGVTTTVSYSTTHPTAKTVELTTNYDGGTIYYTLDGTSPATDNGTEYTGAVSIPQGTVKLTSAVFANGEKISEDFCHTYINNAGRHLGVQTDATKITGTNTTVSGTNYVKYAFDGVNEFKYSPTESNYMSLYRGYYQNPITATVEYETPITVDTLTAAVRVCEAQYLTDVSAGGNGTNSDKKQEKKTEYLKKDLSVQLKVDYVKEGESEFTEGAWQTVTMPAGYECEWNYEYKYGAAWTYLPAISFDAATVSKIRISIKDYATGNDLADVRLWSIKEYELYKSNGISYEVLYSKPSGVVPSETTIALNSNKKDTVVRYTVDGSAPTKDSAQYSAPIKLGSNSTMKINAAVFDNDGNMLSDVFSNVYVTGKYTNRAVQTAAEKISYTQYNEPNNRLPGYAFDGNDEFAGAHAVWTLKALDITVSYDSAVKADAMLIGGRMDKNIIDEDKLVTKEDAYITVDVKAGATSVTGGNRVLLLPAGSKVTKASQSDGVNTTISYWAWFGTGAVDDINSTELTYSIKDFSGVGAIKEIELVKTGKLDITVEADGDNVVIKGLNTFDEDFDVTVIKAGYVIDGEFSTLVGTEMKNWQIKSGGSEQNFDAGSFGEITNAKVIKYFVWEMDSLTPVSDFGEISID